MNDDEKRSIAFWERVVESEENFNRMMMNTQLRMLKMLGYEVGEEK